MDLKDKIKVMQHFAEGGKVEHRRRTCEVWYQVTTPSWDWKECDYRIQSPKTKQPLTAADFPPGTVVKWADASTDSWFLVLYVGGLSISIQSRSTLLYTDLLAQWQYSTDQGKTWLPCYKEV